MVLAEAPNSIPALRRRTAMRASRARAGGPDGLADLELLVERRATQGERGDQRQDRYGFGPIPRATDGSFQGR